MLQRIPGHFSVRAAGNTEEFRKTLHHDVDYPWWRLSGFIKNRSYDHADPFLLTPESAQAALQATPRDTLEKLDHLIRLLGKFSVAPGYWVRFFPVKDHTYSFSETPQEFLYLLDELIGEELVSARGDEYRLTINGWRRARELAYHPSSSSQAFIAMSFSDALRPAFEIGHAPAIKRVGFTPIRLDYMEHVGKIDDRIIVEINRSRFLIADVTEQRPGVYFEAGYAIGRGIPVIWCCRRDDLKQVHFDTRQFNHVVWDTPDDLREKLETRIRAAIP